MKPDLAHRRLEKSLIRTHRGFLPSGLAHRLRREFLSVFSDPRHSHPKRFLWDHWHIPNQYLLHRTLAENFFSESSFSLLCNALVRFGQDQLGCHSISKPWLSYYTEGDYQSLHTDAPHGPWAYVFSLTDWSRRHFTGGETFLQHPKHLNYWMNYSRSRGLETNDFYIKIPSLWNQLTVFDPRLPHGVTPVRGTQEPTQARLVVHGWFVHPEPFVTGALAQHSLTALVASLNALWGPILSQLPNRNLKGALIFRLFITPSGRVKAVKILSHSLIRAEQGQIDIQTPRQLQREAYRWQLPRARGSSAITLPLIFD